MVKPFKPEYGQKVYLQPLGNAARSWNGKPIIGYVSAVKRKYFYVEKILDGIRNGEIRIEIETGHCFYHDWNIGYNAFPSEEAFYKHMEVERKRARLMCNTHWMQKASGEAIEAIYELLEREGIAEPVSQVK